MGLEHDRRRVNSGPAGCDDRCVRVVLAFTDLGGIVIVNRPLYTSLYVCKAHASRGILKAPLGQNLRIDLGTLEDAFCHVRARGKRAV